MKNQPNSNLFDLSKLLLACFVAVVFVVFPFVSPLGAQDKKKESTVAEVKTDPSKKLLEWNNGNILPGKLIRGSDKAIFWQSDLFRGDLEIDVAALNNLKFPRDESQRSTKEQYFVRTVSGDKLYGNIERIDADGLVLNSNRSGQVVIKRDQIGKLVHLGNSGYVFMGISDLEDWDSLKRTKKHWRVSDSGDLESTKQSINLFYQTEFPDAVQIDFVIKWEKNLDLVFGLGVPSNTKVLENLPRIESWEDSLVLNQEDDFAIIYESIPANQKRLALQIQWDRKTNKVVIRDEKGVELCETTVPDKIRGVRSGIYLENKKGDMKVETLRISKTAAGYDPSKKGIQLTDGTIKYGELVSFDGNIWTVKNEETDETEEISSDKFRTALITNSGVKGKQTNTLIRFQDGALATGTLKGIADNKITLETDFCTDPVSYDLTGISVVRFISEGKTKTLTGNHTLYTSYGELLGEVFAGTGKDNDVLRWRPVGCNEGLPLTNADARIVLSTETTVVNKSSEWPDTLYFNNKDTIPCRIVSIDDSKIRFESFAENTSVDQNLIKAIDFSAMRVSGSVACDDPGWYFSDPAKEKVEVNSKKEMIIRGPGRFGHSSLSSVGTLKYSLNWKKGGYNVFECRSFVRHPKDSSGGLGVSIMLWDGTVMISDADQANQFASPNQVSTPRNEADVEIIVKDGKLVVRVNGKRAYSKKISPKQMRGNAVSFSLKNMNGNRPQVTLGNISVLNEGTGSAPIFVSPEAKELLLTIPRLRKDNPPKHILCARNSDLLRGELTSMDEKKIVFQSRLDDFTFDRNVVSSIVWLHAKTAKELKKEAEQEKEDEKIVEKVDEKTSDQVVQILMKGGQRLTVNARLWSEKTFDGISLTLGKCSIPIKDIKELRLGKFATEAVDVAYADWVAVPAVEPKLEDGSGASDVAFGKDSPLIGKTPKDFTLKMLDGTEFKLSENKGKVIVLDFWATWCGPCVKALPAMVKATDSFDTDKVIFIAVNQLEEPELIEMFMKRRNLEMKVALDNGDFGDLFNVTSIPQSVIIDAEGKIAFSKVGAESDLENKMVKAIRQIVEGDSADESDAAATENNQDE